MALPSLNQYLDDPNTAQPVNPAPEPTGTGNWFTAGLGSGAYQALGELGSAGEAVARGTGFNDIADKARAFADAQRATAATYARPDLESAGIFDPKAIAYRLAQSLPVFGAGLVGAGAAALAAPEVAGAGILGGAAAMLPSAIGGNVQRREDYQGDLDTPNAWKAIALGIPEAALQGILPAKLEAGLLKGVGGGFIGSVAKMAGIQAPVGATSDWLTQQMGDPNRTFADKAQEVINAGLSGGVLGGVTGGLLHPLSPQRAIAKTPPSNVTTDALLQASEVPPPPPPMANPLPAPGDIVRARTVATLEDRVNALGRPMQGPGMPPPPPTPPPAAPVFGSGTNGMVGAPPIEPPINPLAGLDRAGVGPNSPPIAPKPVPLTEYQGEPAPPVTPPPPPPFDWESQRKTFQQGKAYDPLVMKGPFASQDELNNTVAENIFSRLADGKKVDRRLLAGGELLGIIDDKGEPTPEYAQKAQEIIAAKTGTTPPGAVVEPDQAGPTPGAFTPPDRLERAAIDLKHQGRWDALEVERNRLLGDNLSDPDVQELLSQASDLQNRLLKPGRGGSQQIEAATKALQAQVDARSADARTNPVGAPVDKNAPAVGPDPSPAAAAVIAKAQPQAEAEPTTKEAKVKAARNTKTTPEPAVTVTYKGQEFSGPDKLAAVRAAHAKTGDDLSRIWDAVTPETSAPAPATMRDQVVQEAVANGEAPAGVTKTELADLKPNPEFAQAFTRQAENEGKTPEVKTPMDLGNEPPALTQEQLDAFNKLPSREEAIERDQRIWEYRQTAYPEDVAARAQSAERVEAPTEQPVVPQTKEARAKAAKETLDPKTAARQQAAGRLPPVVDPSLLSGFAREDRRTQADFRRESLNTTLRNSLARVESDRSPVVSVTPKIAEMLQSARDALTKLEQSGAPNTRYKSSAERFQQLIAQHREQLNLVERAVRLSGIKGLREVPRDYFSPDLFDEMSTRVTPETEKNLEQHATAESHLQEAAAIARGERPLIKYSTPPTQHDVDITNVIKTTNRMDLAVGYVRDNGTSTQAREMAHILLKNGAGRGTVSMSDNPNNGSTRQPRDGEYVAGRHFLDNNHTDIYDGGGVEHTLLHEAAHAATEHALRAGGPAAQEMHGIFDRFKARSGDDDAYGLTNTSEFVAEAMSNPTFEQLLKSESVSTGSRIGDMWQSFKNTVFKMLGMPERMRTLFDQVMDTSNRLMGENVAEASGNVNLQVMRGGQQFSELSDQAGNELVRKLQREFDNGTTKLSMGTRKAALGVLNGDHIQWQLAPHIPSVNEFMEYKNHRTIRTSTLMKHLADAFKAVSALPDKAKDAWNKIAQSSIQNLDGSRSWKDNTWLHGDPQAAELQQEHTRVQNAFNVLRNTKGGIEAYQKSVDANEVSRHLRDLHLLYDAKQRGWGGETWTGYDTDPIRDYEANDRLHDDPAAGKLQLDARKLQMVSGMAKKAADLETLVNNLKVKEKAGLSSTLKMTPEELRAEIVKQEANHEELSGLVGDISGMDERAKQGAYFHLGREGDHFVTAHVITDNGIPNDKALQTIKARMEAAGMGDHIISRGVGNSSIYLRMEGQTQRENAFHLFEKLRDEGFIDASPTKPVARGVAADSSVYKSVGPQWMRQAIAAVEAQAPEFPLGADTAMMDSIQKAHDQQKREMVRSLMDMLPDTSITKIYAKRANVQGFNENMMNAYKASALANARGLSSMSLAREIGLAATKMNNELKDKNASNQISGKQLTAISQAMGELSLRDKLYQAHVPSTFMDSVRGLTHTFQIGASPAYFFALMSQIPTLTLPELAKTHGYARSALALGKTTTEALQVMAAVLKGKDGVTFGLRRADLEKAGVSPGTVDFIMNLASRGAFNEGAFTEQMAGHDTDSRLSKIGQVANMLGRYSEQFPRILTALAARELHTSQPGKAGGMALHDFAFDKVVKSQLNWNPELTARQMTKAGNFGAMSPLINQFMGFQTRMTEKLYREISTAFGSGEEAKQARTWLVGHAAAVTMLAGTLGLPMVSVAASVFDRLSDWLENKNDVDVIASYRKFLNQSLGEGFGEAVARGAPRLAGMDFDHLGEGSMLPGVPGGPIMSKLIMAATEKRKLEDAEKDWLKNMAGSSMGFIFNSLSAARDLTNGDVMDAGIKVVPEIFKGPLEALRLGQRGFVNRDGSPLPITANAMDVMMKAVGIDPAKEAEYDDETKTLRGLQNLRRDRAQNITRHMILAEHRHDGGMMQSWQREAIQFQRDNPGVSGPLMDFQRAMMTQARNAAVAAGMGTPLGTQPRDIVGRGMTSFGNLRNGE